MLKRIDPFKVLILIISLNFFGDILFQYIKHYFGNDLVVPALIIRLVSLFTLSIILISRFGSFWEYLKREKYIKRLLLLLLCIFIVQSILYGFSDFKLEVYYYLLYLTIAILIINVPNLKLKKDVSQLSKNLVYLLFILLLMYLPTIISDPSLSFRVNRPSLLLGNANEDAGLLITLLPFGYYTLRNNKLQKIIFATFSIFILIFYNGSRYAILGYIIITTLSFLLNKRLRFRFIFLTFIAMTFAVFLSFNYLNKYTDYDDALNNFASVASGNYDTGNLAGRIGGIWIPAINYTAGQSLWFGFGAGSWFEQAYNFTFNRVNYKTINTFRAPHNLFIYNFIQFGLLGLIALFSIFFQGIYKTLKYIYKNKGSSNLGFAAAVLSSWIGLLLWSLVANAWPSFSFPLIFILLTFTYSLKEIGISPGKKFST